jgi:hypothetical protein
MDMDTWIPVYREIARNLGLVEEEDRRASEDLLKFISRNRFITESKISIEKMKALIEDRDCLLIGGGPTLEEDVSDLSQRLEGRPKDGGPVIITADGSTSVLISAGISPDIIVTDLDGGIEDQVKAVGDGAIMVLHAHGDNKVVVRKTVKQLSGMVIASTQIDPVEVPGTVNFGGFTDGDRAAHLADSLGASSITLLAYDTSIVGDKLQDGGMRREIDDRTMELKRRKLRWADRLLNMVNRVPLKQYRENFKELLER